MLLLLVKLGTVAHLGRRAPRLANPSFTYGTVVESPCWHCSAVVRKVCTLMRTLLVKDITVSLAISSQADTTTIRSSVTSCTIDTSHCQPQLSKFSNKQPLSSSETNKLVHLLQLCIVHKKPVGAECTCPKLILQLVAKVHRTQGNADVIKRSIGTIR